MNNKDQLLIIIKKVFGPRPVVTEHRFHPKRMWRFDYAIPSLKIAIEYQGHGAMNGGSKHVGGHASVKGLSSDAEKFNQAEVLGWRVLLFTALHFSELKRRKHKLTSPLETLEALARDETA
jgi:hypothetical protein